MLGLCQLSFKSSMCFMSWALIKNRLIPNSDFLLTTTPGRHQLLSQKRHQKAAPNPMFFYIVNLKQLLFVIFNTYIVLTFLKYHGQTTFYWRQLMAARPRGKCEFRIDLNSQHFQWLIFIATPECKAFSIPNFYV